MHIPELAVSSFDDAHGVSPMSLVDMETINQLGEEDNGNPAINRIEFFVGYAIASAGCLETWCFIGGSGWLGATAVATCLAEVQVSRQLP
jgi:hypothetical protein